MTKIVNMQPNNIALQSSDEKTRVPSGRARYNIDTAVDRCTSCLHVSIIFRPLSVTTLTN